MHRHLLLIWGLLTQYTVALVLITLPLMHSWQLIVLTALLVNTARIQVSLSLRVSVQQAITASKRQQVQRLLSIKILLTFRQVSGVHVQLGITVHLEQDIRSYVLLALTIPQKAYLLTLPVLPALLALIVKQQVLLLSQDSACKDFSVWPALKPKPLQIL